MVCLKEFVSVGLLIAFLLAFTSAKKDKELAALDKRVDKIRRFLLLHAWMESERETSGRSKRATKSRRRAKFRLPYFPLYPIDMPVCKDAERESQSGRCKSWAMSGYCEKVKYVMSRYCPKECKYCKQFSPPGCQSGKYGCCWNNLEARGLNGRGCPVCRDSYGRLCRLFEYYCPKPGKYGQFVRYHCFKTCGWCDKFAQLRTKQASDAV